MAVVLGAVGWLVGAAVAWSWLGPLVAALLFVWVVPLIVVVALFRGVGRPRRPLGG
jgi:hypothetical protein